MSGPEAVSLPGGEGFLWRPISAEDKGLIAEAFDRLSPESRYRRFFAPLDRLSERDLAYLTEVDHHDHEAIVAVDPENGAIIGVARYVRAEDPAEAEVAVVVADPWHGRGVATALLERLVGRAREEGIEHFVAIVLSDNDEALDLLGHLSPEGVLSRGRADGNTELVIDLPEPGGVRDSRLGRVLAATAREAPLVNPWRVFRRAILRRPTEEMRLPD
ncbi:MAG TPA: GNAT family N-acetyltransferase [Solirubrobacterales bacterium]|nr:GNAT family N-acetyltransferase [Solirubrobacterales bacterium]